MVAGTFPYKAFACWLALLSIVFGAVPSACAEREGITIVDSHGLTRAFRRVEGVAVVDVVVSGSAAEPAPVLAHVDGIAADITGVRSESIGGYSFTSVRPGTWQLKNAEKLTVKEINIRATP